MMQSYARNEGEFLQLYQSFILAHLLMPALSGYAVEHGAYPDRLEDAFGPLGRVNEEAWRSVLTGEPMVIGERKSSTCIFYERTEDGNHYELYVPLFGAGAEKPLGLNQSEFRREEYCAGKYFRYTSKTTYSYAL